MTSLRFAAAALVLAIVAVAAPGCDETLPAPLPSASQAARFDVRPKNPSCIAGAVPVGPVRLAPIYKGLDRPVRMVDRPDRGLVYIAEMPGRLKVVDKATGVITTALDLIGKVGTQEDLGMFGFAIHPTKPFAYLIVDRDADAKTLEGFPHRAELVRFTMAADGRTFDPASEKFLLRFDRQNHIHHAGTAEFGPDGRLYIGVGDGGRAVTSWPSDSILGSVLRIDVDNGDPYAIPSDNPYASGGGRGEIFAGGFRNPWRFTFDRQTGEIWAGDVGGNRFEEVDRVERGKNYGWPVFEGPSCLQTKEICDAAAGGFTPPVFVYPHSEGRSITGGYVYRGKALPELVGKYVYGDFTAGRVRALDLSGPEPRVTFLNPGGPKPLIASLGEDAEGELYVMGWDMGTIFQLVKGDDVITPTFPLRLSETGCVDVADPTKMATGLVPYGVNTELWSDGAQKKRFFAIPDGTTLHATPEGHLDLPKGGLAIKEFSIDGRRIETRFLRRHPDDTWTGATYEWNDAQTDAVLLEGAKDKKLANGQTWSFPSPIECFVCHQDLTGMTLGTEAMQLNGDFDYVPGQRTNQLTTLADIGYVDARLEPGKTTRMPGIESSAPVADRARAYLHTNCSFCHREKGPTGAPMDFRYGLPLAAIKGCSFAGNSGGRGTTLLVPGKPQESVIYLRMTSRGEVGYGPMPALATNRVDDVAASVLSTWITSLMTCE